MIDNATADAYGQAAPGYAARGGRRPSATARRRTCGPFDGEPGALTEMDALVAYLQILGRLTDAAHEPVAAVGR